MNKYKWDKILFIIDIIWTVVMMLELLIIVVHVISKGAIPKWTYSLMIINIIITGIFIILDTKIIITNKTKNK